MITDNRGVIFRDIYGQSETVAPDSFNASRGSPPPTFVLCRDLSGVATATYGEEVWDFGPYTYGGSKRVKMKFPKEKRLSQELKQLMFLLIYFSRAGRSGKLMASSFGSYWRGLRAAEDYCESLEGNKLVGQISLKQLFTNEAYLNGFSYSYPKGSELINKVFPPILNHLIDMGEDIVGYVPINGQFLSKNRRKTDQHPIIPARLYINLIQQLEEYIDVFLPYGEKLEEFISCLSDPFYGLCIARQKKGGLNKADFRPNFSKALSDHGLAEVISGKLYAADKKVFFSVVRKIQYVIKTIIRRQLAWPVRDN
jgi:hypothetical protein